MLRIIKMTHPDTFKGINMPQKHCFLLSSVISIAVSFSTNVFADASHDHSASFSSTKITPQITLLQGKGGNVAALTGDQGTLIIDDDYLDMSPALTTALEPLGGLEKLTYIINTHWHGDHTGGNKVLGDHATIVAHDNVRKRLLSKQEIELFNMVSEPYPEPALPSVTYEKSMTLHFNGETVELMHLAKGHTDGDSVVIFKNANVVHMGDHFFNGFFPFVDVSSGGNVLTMAENVAIMLNKVDDNTVIIPGHGPLAKKADLEAFHLMLKGTAEEVQTMKDKGMNLKAMQAQGLSEKWNSWTDGFLNTETWISIIDASL